MLVDVGYVLGQAQVSISVRFVLNQPEEVKTREQSSGQLDVLLNGFAGIVAAISRVSRCENRAACIQGGHDASLQIKTNKRRLM